MANGLFLNNCNSLLMNTRLLCNWQLTRIIYSIPMNWREVETLCLYIWALARKCIKCAAFIGSKESQFNRGNKTKNKRQSEYRKNPSLSCCSTIRTFGACKRQAGQQHKGKVHLQSSSFSSWIRLETHSFLFFYSCSLLFFSLPSPTILVKDDARRAKRRPKRTTIWLCFNVNKAPDHLEGGWRRNGKWWRNWWLFVQYTYDAE